MNDLINEALFELKDSRATHDLILIRKHVDKAIECLTLHKALLEEKERLKGGFLNEVENDTSKQ